jgi:hypothetical protein
LALLRWHKYTWHVDKKRIYYYSVCAFLFVSQATEI